MTQSEDEQRKLEEIRRKAEEEEERRIEEEVERQTEVIRKLRGKKKGAAREEEEDRRREEEAQRKAEEEARHQQEEEDRRRREEEERKRQEEESRRRREEEEARRRREEEEQREREEEERRQREEEERRRQQKEREHIQTILRKAEEYLDRKDFANALEESGKVLASDPTHTDALALNERIRSSQTAIEEQKAKEAQRVAEEQKKAVETEAKKTEPRVEVRREKPLPRKRALPKRAIIGVIAAAAVIGIGIFVFQTSKRLFEGKRYIAVLPFKSQTNSGEERVLGRALAEEIASLLGYFPDGRIMGGSSALNLQKSSRDLRRQVNKLNFAYTISGTITTSNFSIVLFAEIIDTLGNKFWTGKIEKPRGRVMDIAAELTRTVSEEFDIDLPKETSDLEERALTDYGDAYLLYLRGREMLHQRTNTATTAALEFFRQAITQDPRFAKAYAAAAHSYFRTFEAGWSDDIGLLSRAEEFAKKALGVYPNLSEARAVLGGVFQQRTKYNEAINILKQAIAEMPNNAEAHRLAGLVYTIAGKEDKAMEHLKFAYEIDPANVDVLTSFAFVHQRFSRPKEAMTYFDQALSFIPDTSTFLAEVAGNALVSSYQYSRAINLYEQRTELDPRNFVNQYKLARSYQLAGEGAKVWSKAFEKTIALAQQELRQRPQNALAFSYLGLAYSRYGRFPEGAANGKKAAQMAPNNLTVKYKLADIYSIQKKKTEAIAALREAVRNRYLLSEVADLDLFNISDAEEFAQTIAQQVE